MFWNSGGRHQRALAYVFLPPAKEVWGKVIFLHQFVILFTGGVCVVAWGGVCGCSGGACMVAPGGHVWLLGGMRGCSGGACVVALGGACVVAPGGHAWLLWGGMCVVAPGGACVVLFGGACVVLFGGACMVLFKGGMHGFIGGCAWFFQFFRIQWDTVNERAVRILLECILVGEIFAWTLCRGVGWHLKAVGNWLEIGSTFSWSLKHQPRDLNSLLKFFPDSKDFWRNGLIKMYCDLFEDR